MVLWCVCVCFNQIEEGESLVLQHNKALVSDDERYHRDSLEDRWAVFGSVLAASCVNVVAVPVFVLLCPSDRSEVKALKASLGKSKLQAQIYAAVFCLGYVFIFVFNAMMMMPQTQCYEIIGGEGCNI